MIVVNSENFSPELNAQNLGTAFEFKIHIDAGKEDCFFQMIETNASFYAAFHVSIYEWMCKWLDIYIFLYFIYVFFS